MYLPKYERKKPATKVLEGVDLFVQWQGKNPDELAGLIKEISQAEAQLTMITNRGIKVWPDGFNETFCTDHWRCRFKPSNGMQLTKQTIIDLLAKAEAKGLDTIKTENLYSFNGKPAFSLGQGQ
jgi:isocitrate dehydrogenase